MIKVHHLENSRSHRVVWLLEEIGAPYEVIQYKRDPVTKTAMDDLRAVHPLGKSPVIEDDGLVVAETAAILDYLASQHGGLHLIPNDLPARARYLQWLHAAEGTVMPPLTIQLQLRRIGVEGAPLQRVDAGLRTLLDYAAAELKGRTWFAGDAFSLADIMMVYPLLAAQARGNFTDAHAPLVALIERAAARPAYRRALKHGGGLEIITK